MPNTTYGTPYVASSDLVSAYPGTSSTLATRIDDISLKGNGINAQTASYTLVLTDGGKNITMTVATANTLTVPTNASVAFPTGASIGVVNLGAGACTITPASGVTVNGSSLVLAQYETGVLLKTGTNTWVFAKGGGLPKASYSATTGSPTVTTVSGKTCLTFTGSGTISVNTAGICDVLVQGAGGGANGGSSTYFGAGAGAGTFNTASIYLPVGTYTVTVGAGGAGAAQNSASNTSGSNSELSIGTNSVLRGYAGGRGNVQSGGSNADFSGTTVTATFSGAGAGAGGNASSSTGGVGVSSSFTGSAVTYGTGGSSTNGNPGAQTANRGHGGSGGGNGASGQAGSSGVVIILIG